MSPADVSKDACSSAGPTLSQALRLGAALGLATGLWQALLEIGSARSAEMIWTLEMVWLNPILYGIVGLLLGCVAAGVLEVVRRRMFPGIHGWAWAAAWLGLGGYSVRTLGYSVGRSLIRGGEINRQIVWILPLVLLLLGLALVLFHGLRPQRFREGLVAGICLMIPTVAVGYFSHVLLVSDRIAAAALASSGAIRFAMIAGSILTALALGSLLWVGIRSRTPAAKVVLVAAALAVGAILVGGLRLQSPHAVEPGGPPPAAGAPNVLVVVLDTLRRDAVSTYGLVSGTTPNLDRFGAEGVVWEDAIVPGNWTIPGHASLFTGALVSRHGAGLERPTLRLRPGGPDTDELPTLAESFRQRGWTTAAFVCNGQLSRSGGYDRGFERYFEVWRARKGDFDSLGQALKKMQGFGVNDLGGDTTARGLDWWFKSHADADRPWFVFVNFLEPHSPYSPPEPWLNRFVDEPTTRERAAELSRLADRYKFGGAPADTTRKLWELYLGSVAYQDHLVGRVLESLDAAGVADDTIVVITSDHGENFGWGGQLYHGGDLNDDLIRVPLLARGPGLPSGARAAEPASVIDLFPTLLALTGGEALANDPGRPGRDLLAAAGSVGDPPRVRIAERYADYLESRDEFIERHPDVDPGWAQARSAILSGEWKAVEVAGSDTGRLTRLAGSALPPKSDGRIVVEDPALLEELLARLRTLRASWPQAVDAAPEDIPAPDAETLEQLKALGYLGD